MPTRFCIRDTRSCTYVLFTDIVRFEGSNNYTRVYLKNKQSRLLCSSLCRQYEKVKGTGLFFRIHKSHVINIQYVIHIFNNGTVVLTDGTELPCNPGEKEELIELMEK